MAPFRTASPTPVSAAPPRVVLRDAVTGQEISVPAALTRADRVAELRRRIKTSDVQAASLPADDGVHVELDGSGAITGRYWLARYPPLGHWGSLRMKWWYVIFGAFLIAAASRVQFFFPCVSGTTAVDWSGASYCVPPSDLPRVTPTSCPQDVCTKRIPVTLQTYAALLNGAIAGPTGAWATLLYVAMVCLGAPFGSDGTSRAVWQRGALIGPTGGFFAGMVLASWVMGRCAQAGHDRPRATHRMLLWMVAAEAAIYTCGMFWFPLGLAIARNVSPSAVCPDFGTPLGAERCLKLVVSATLTPFIPGELLKMLLVLLTVPLSWAVLLAVHKKWGGLALVPPQEEDEEAGVGAGVGAGGHASEEGEARVATSTSTEASERAALRALCKR